MICPTCNHTRLSIEQTYSTGACMTHVAVCGKCDKKFTLLTVIATEADSYGKGAAALAAKLKKGLTPREILEAN